ncbi:hypothetical protein diail_7102 [Diaporthe ilicicola]|nr:hypothetical protein diail_7102 [Diaporthe ilicicola]
MSQARPQHHVDDFTSAYFSHPADLEVFARHLLALETELRGSEASASASAPFFKPDGKRHHPDAFHIGDLERARKYILDTATTAYHSWGTAAMLPREKGGCREPRTDRV